MLKDYSWGVAVEVGLREQSAATFFLKVVAMAAWILSTILTLSLSALPPCCDMLEINHYMPCGKVQFVQAIAWDWSPEYRRFHAQDWAMVGRWNHRDGVVTFSSPEAFNRVLVRCRLFRETWTTVDPERENQVLFPMSERRKVF